MKRFFSKALALSMAGTMIFSANVSASPTPQPQTANVEIPSTVTSPVYEVVVPAATGFTINPLKIGASIDTQIYSPDILVVNKSNVPVEMSVTVTPKLATTTPKPLIKLEDEVLAASADMTNVNKFASMYVAPTTKIELDTAGDVLKPGTGLKYAQPTQYIGTGTTLASFTTVLNASNNYTSVWAAPTKLADADTAVAFKILGSVNKNAAWAADDLKVTVAWKFVGMDKDTYDNTAFVSTYANITKAAHGTGAVVDTPRFREKVYTLDLATISGAEEIGNIELGSTAATALKVASTTLAPSLSAITLTNNGVADTTTLKTTDFTVAVDTTGDEAGLIATVELSEAGAKKLISGNAYALTGFTLKLGTGTYVAGTGAGITINPTGTLPVGP